MYLIVSWQNSWVQIDIISYIIKLLQRKLKHLWATVSTTFLWSSQVLQSPKIKWHRAAREVESPRSECVENRSSLKMMIIKTSFQPGLSTTLDISSEKLQLRVKMQQLHSIQWSSISCQLMYFMGQLPLIYFCTRALQTKFNLDRHKICRIGDQNTRQSVDIVTSWHHRNFGFHTDRKLRSGGALTCSCPLDEQRGLSPHGTLFEHLHHSSMTGRSHRLLVHLQDQVSFYEAGGCLRARLQHLASRSNKFINMLFRSTPEQKSCITVHC